MPIKRSLKACFAAALGASVSIATPAWANDLDCNSEHGLDKLGCYAILTPLMALGIIGSVTQSARDAMTPDIPVRVELDDGNIVHGHLTPEIARDRVVHPDDLVRVHCDPSYSPKDNACSLSFAREGQADCWIGVSPDGVPQQDLLKLDGKVKIPLPKGPVSP